MHCCAGFAAHIVPQKILLSKKYLESNGMSVDIFLPRRTLSTFIP